MRMRSELRAPRIVPTYVRTSTRALERIHVIAQGCSVLYRTVCDSEAAPLFVSLPFVSLTPDSNAKSRALGAMTHFLEVWYHQLDLANGGLLQEELSKIPPALQPHAEKINAAVKFLQEQCFQMQQHNWLCTRPEAGMDLSEIDPPLHIRVHLYNNMSV